MTEYLNVRGFDNETITKWKLDDKKALEKVYIPYFDRDASYLYSRTRYYGPDTTIDKYYMPSGYHLCLYGLWLLNNEVEEIVIVEGEINAASIGMLGFYVLGVPGQALRLSEDILKDLPLSIKAVTILFDEPGFAQKRAQELKQYYGDAVKIKIAVYPR